MDENVTVVEKTGEQLVTDNLKAAGVHIVEDFDEPKPEPEPKKLSESEEVFSNYMVEFAKRNYKKIISPSGRQIKINGQYYTIAIINEDVEDKFSELETNMQKASASMDTKKTREALYEFLMFACSITREQLRYCDRGHLKNIALILGMIQKGFCDL